MADLVGSGSAQVEVCLTSTWGSAGEDGASVSIEGIRTSGSIGWEVAVLFLVRLLSL